MSAGEWTDWTDAVWECLELMDIHKGQTFSLNDIYAAEHVLRRIYPDNEHIEDKIRQQLQIMRDAGRLEFINNKGIYRRLE